MSSVWDKLLVGIAVLAATVYACHALAPRAWRRAVYARLGIKLKDAAAGCSACESCHDAAPTAGEREITVPVNRIRRRDDIAR